MTIKAKKKREKKKRPLMLHCRHEGCLYHRTYWTMGGMTLKKALRKLKNHLRCKGALRRLAPCSNGKNHHWVLVRP